MDKYLRTLPLLLLAILAMIAAPTYMTTTTVPVLASSSSDEDEEENQDDDNNAPLGEEPVAVPAAPPVQQQFPFTTPSPPNETAAPAPTTPTEQEGVTAQDLIAKYGANRTITLEATGQTIGAGGENVTGDKAIILTFDDNWKSQHDFASPILENNDFGGTFFVYCLGVDQGPAFMTSGQVRDLYAKGFDIQSHSMTHPDLTHVDADTLDFEIAQSKPCLEDMVPGLNVSIFATPFATGEDNSTILQKIADSGYEFARVGYGNSFNIQCAGWYVPDNQSAGCQMFEPGTNKLKFQNGYNMPTLDVNALGRENNHDLAATQSAFEGMINDAITYENETGKVVSLPILVYHNFTDQVLPEMGQSMLAESFAQQMQYLKDNGFVALSIRDLVYNPTNATFTIPSLDRLGYTNATAAATNATTTPTA